MKYILLFFVIPLPFSFEKITKQFFERSLYEVNNNDIRKLYESYSNKKLMLVGFGDCYRIYSSYDDYIYNKRSNFN